MAINSINFIGMAALRKRTSHSHSGVYNQMDAGLLPRSVKIGPKRVAWIEHEIDEILKARLRGCSDAEIKELVRSLEAQRAELAAPSRGAAC